MKDVNTRLLELERMVGQLSSQSDRVAARPGMANSPNPIRLARTYNNGAYPGASDANTFPATFIDATFTEAGGLQTAAVDERDTTNVIFVHNVFDKVIPVGTKIPVVYENGRWFTWYNEGTGSNGDADGLVRIKNTTGSPATCDAISRVVSTCHYSGKIVTLAGSPNFCDDPWTEGTDVWIFDSVRCDIPTQLKFNDVYHARKLSDSFQPSNGLGLRPLYVVRSSVTSGSDVKIIKVTSAGGLACEDAATVSTECIYTGKLQSISLAGPTMCAPFSDGADVFAFKVSSCCSTDVKKDERYLALKVGSFTSTYLTSTRDLYAIIGSYCSESTHTQLVYVNEHITYDDFGDALLADDLGTGPLATGQSATTLVVNNPFNGDLVAGMLVPVTKMQIEMTGDTYWCVNPMTLIYTGKAVSNILAGGSGPIKIWKDDADTGVSVTAAHTWLTGNKTVGGATEVFITWFPADKSWRITGATCS